GTPPRRRAGRPAVRAVPPRRLVVRGGGGARDGAPARRARPPGGPAGLPRRRGARWVRSRIPGRLPPVAGRRRARCRTRRPAGPAGARGPAGGPFPHPRAAAGPPPPPPPARGGGVSRPAAPRPPRPPPPPPSRAPGPAGVFRGAADRRTADRLRNRLAPLYGGGVRVQPVSGDHWSMLTLPHARDLATRLLEALPDDATAVAGKDGAEDGH